MYADPVVVNGMPMTVAQLADRARSLQESFDRLSMQILDQVETSERLVIAFIMRGRHVGPYPSLLGTIPPTGREIAVRTIDVLTIQDGLVSAITVVADDLGLLTQIGPITPAGRPCSRPRPPAPGRRARSRAGCGFARPARSAADADVRAGPGGGAAQPSVAALRLRRLAGRTLPRAR